MYSLFFKKIRPYKKLKKEAERVAGEVLASSPTETDVQLSVQRTPDPSNRFQVSMLVRGLARPVIITKVGNGMFQLLKQVEKTALTELHRLKDKRVAMKRNYTRRVKEQQRFALAQSSGDPSTSV